VFQQALEARGVQGVAIQQGGEERRHDAAKRGRRRGRG
jgi:hypothetical protein